MLILAWDPFRALPTLRTSRTSYVADLTIPDGTALAPGASFVKTWRLRNSGTCSWTTAYALAFAGGEKFGAPAFIALPADVAPGEEIDVSAKFTAPMKGGAYKSQWKLLNASGAIFGLDNSADGTFWADIKVGSTAIGPSSISGAVWADYCTPLGGEGAPATPSGGCIADVNGGYRADGLWNNGEAGIGGVVVTLAPGACPGDGSRAVTATTGFGGSYRFEKLNAGTYCVSINPQSAGNLSLLIPGEWTFPAVSVGSVTINLGAGENKTGANFGWDAQFK